MKKTVFIICASLFWSCNPKGDKEKSVLANESKSEMFTKEKPRAVTDYSNFYKEAQQYCKDNKLNQEKFILIDLGIHSGLKRFFVYDFNKNAVVKSYMVSHGCADNRWGGTESKENPVISNEFDSHCSSTGKYVILNRGVSQWGIKVNYVLQGKDKSNSNSAKRAIVLHSWEAIPENEVYPEGTPEGWGCPAVSNESMKEIDEILKQHKKVLMWVIKS
ncbi:murein L,D-transpeptidase catalytic domain-containing protein [Flavobacterium chungangense]|uniref:Peptidase n=1 Tax=Flavobacterium chungangense TaxID=554283 RepID=A0A6V6Z564_9FLAO|nr:murein L,D-transpeptidase catalytic domain family protein [Flavobacterium chungangense]CAD0006082.1 peptidase [Flavobacterium chungangense]